MSQARVAVLKVITKELTVTAAAAQYGYSRQHLHRLLKRYEAGDRRRRPTLTGTTPTRQHHQRRGPRTHRGTTSPAHRRGTGRRPGNHRLAPRARKPPPPLDLDDPTDPPHSRADHPRTQKATPVLLPTLRSRPAQRVLAVRLHPLAPGRRHRHRDPQLARRPLPLPDLLHRPHPGHRRRRREHLHRSRQRTRPPSLDTDRQRPRLHRPTRRREQRLRVPPDRPADPPEERPTRTTPRPKAKSNASTRPRNAG